MAADVISRERGSTTRPPSRRNLKLRVNLAQRQYKREAKSQRPQISPLAALAVLMLYVRPSIIVNASLSGVHYAGSERNYSINKEEKGKKVAAFSHFRAFIPVWCEFSTKRGDSASPFPFDVDVERQRIFVTLNGQGKTAESDDATSA